MTATSDRLTPDMARRLALADAQSAVYAASGALGQARRHKRAGELPKLERQLADAQERLKIAKAAA